MSGKVIAGVIFGLIGLIFCIAGVWLDEITRVDASETFGIEGFSLTSSGAAWCGWDSYGFCLSVSTDSSDGCHSAIILSQEDGSTKLDDDTFTDYRPMCQWWLCFCKVWCIYIYIIYTYKSHNKDL